MCLSIKILFQVLKTLLIFSNTPFHISLRMSLASPASFVAFASSLNTFGKLMWGIMWSRSISRDSLFTSVIFVDLTRTPSRRCTPASLSTTEPQNWPRLEYQFNACLLSNIFYKKINKLIHFRRWKLWFQVPWRFWHVCDKRWPNLCLYTLWRF